MKSTKQIGRTILKILPKELAALSCVKSVTLVGSGVAHLNPGGDLDILTITDRLSPANYRAIGQVFRKIAKRVSSSSLSVRLERRIGPIKHESRKQRSIVLHQILYDVPGYQKYCALSPLVAYDWQRFKPLHGLPITQYHNIKNITMQQLLTKRLGIKHYASMLTRGEIDCIIYKRVGNRMIQTSRRLKLSPHQKTLLSKHALQHTLATAMKIITGENKENRMIRILLNKAWQNNNQGD